MSTTYNPILNSTFLDFTGYGITDQNFTAAEAFDISNTGAFPNGAPSGINVALILERANDPTSMLAGDWATRQSTIANLNATDSLWTTYGTSVATYNAAQTYLETTLGLTVLDASNSNYVSTAESRTIWVEINSQADWQALFGPDSTLMYTPDTGQGYELWYWEDGLSLPSELTIAGLWVDMEARPGPFDMAGSATATLPVGPQSAGNSANILPPAAPQTVATSYNFPLDGASYQTGMIGLIEPGQGSYVSSTDPGGSTFESLLTQYRDTAGTQGTGGVFVQGANGQDEASGERSLDVGVTAAINPNSDLALYNGSGRGSGANANSNSTVFTTFQAAIWAAASNYAGTETVGPAPVVSSSDTDLQSLSPLSPFYQAYMQLFIDAALMNQTVLVANGDGGSGAKTGNGLANVVNNVTSPYNILVGGTSLSTVNQASVDPTLNGTNANFSPIYSLAMAGDRGTLWSLVAGGLSQMPGTAAASDWFIETVWNQYATEAGNTFEGGNGPTGHSYTVNNAGSGGVDQSQGTPDYQVAFGLTSSAYSDLNLTGRALPDVAANAGGNLYYLVPEADMSGTHGDGGTSAATPFWASLITQINYILHDQGLSTNLGYMTDLLYMAAVIAPASFNDVQVGNNTSSFSYRGPDYGGMNPTGYGYEAGVGFDLTTGLGSPDGLFLARAISSIAHSQMFYSADVAGVSTLVPDVIDSNGAGGWTSGTAQTLLLQTTATGAATVSVQTGADSTDASSAAHATYAWTSQLAQQSLQSNTDFDPDLLALFDGQTQGALTQAIVAGGASVSVEFNGNTTVAAQAGMSASFGFADFYSDSGNSVRLAQAVAVAETANHADDANVVVRMRQVAGADLSLMLYKVDDYNGTIGGLAPDQAGYAAAAAGRAYAVQGGGFAIAGPGNGNYSQVEITGVDAGDLIAMQLTNVTNGDTFWAFSQANEVVGGEHIAHLWNYGANTWGWEDLHGGGDRDFNDLVVQLDFTSTAGSGLLVA